MAAYKYKTPDDLRKAAQAYFDYVKTHPLHGERKTTTDANGTKIYVDTQIPQPMTFEDLGVFIGIADWQQFADVNRKRGADWVEVIGWIKATIRADQIKGGLAGLYAHNIVCRLNGISENLNVQSAPAPNIVDIFSKKG